MLWNEPKGPDFVLEVTSASTRHDDERRKRDVYAALGVREYFLYDPRAEYLAPQWSAAIGDRARRSLVMEDAGKIGASRDNLPLLLPRCGHAVSDAALVKSKNSTS